MTRFLARVWLSSKSGVMVSINRDISTLKDPFKMFKNFINGYTQTFRVAKRLGCLEEKTI